MSKLLIDDHPIMVLPKLAQAIGLNEAIVLQQIHYWIGHYAEKKDTHHYHKGRWWVYNTKAEWVSNFPWWSESTVWRALKSLRKNGVVITGNFNQRGYDRTLWYTIDYEKLDRLDSDPFTQNDQMALSQNDQMDNVNLTTPIPETTTETTQREDRAAQTAAPPAEQPTFLSEEQTTDITTPEDKLLFREINKIRYQRKHRLLRKYSNTVQKDAWRDVVSRCEAVHNGKHMAVLQKYIELGLVKNITGLPNLIRWVSGCVDNDTEDSQDTGWSIPQGALR